MATRTVKAGMREGKPVGAMFRIEMNEGLAETSRFAGVLGSGRSYGRMIEREGLIR
jgi:hypothetical protein